MSTVCFLHYREDRSKGSYDFFIVEASQGGSLLFQRATHHKLRESEDAQGHTQQMRQAGHLIVAVWAFSRRRRSGDGAGCRHRRRNAPPAGVPANCVLPTHVRLTSYPWASGRLRGSKVAIMALICRSVGSSLLCPNCHRLSSPPSR